MPQSLRPKEYPDFMGKEDDITYKSGKILGRLYRSIQQTSGADFILEDTCTLNNVPYDTDLEVPGASDFLENAWQFRCSYEVQLNALLNQYGVWTEAELVTGEIWLLGQRNNRMQHGVKDRLKYAYSQLRKKFRRIFGSIETDRCGISDDARNLVYEMKASAWYKVTYGPEWIQKTREMMESSGKEMPARLSFAWIVVDYLAQIKTRCHGEGTVEGRMPLWKASDLGL
ncbi:hypothetical protein ACP4OV_027028 [Aristida adscensionis]